MKNAKTKAIKKRGMTKIVIIRHGETKLNKEKRIRGWSDVPLDDHGREEAKKVAKELEGVLDCLVSSDLVRASETAEIISEITGVKIKDITESFRPWDVGKHTGEPQDRVYKVMAEAAREYPDKSLEKGESFNSFKERFLDAISELKKEYPGETIGVVTHHRGDRIFSAWHKAGFPRDYDVDMDTFLSAGIDPGKASEPVEI